MDKSGYGKNFQEMFSKKIFRSAFLTTGVSQRSSSQSFGRMKARPADGTGAGQSGQRETRKQSPIPGPPGCRFPVQEQNTWEADSWPVQKNWAYALVIDFLGHRRSDTVFLQRRFFFLYLCLL